MSSWRRRRCRSCGAVVFWSRTWPGGEELAVDPEPHPRGNVELSDPPPGSTEPIAHVVRPEEDPEGARLFEVDQRVRYRPHWATCPHAERWRRG